MSETQFIATWRNYMAGRAAGLHLADAGHPLQLFIGTTDQGALRLVIRTSARPTKPTLSNVVLVERYEDRGGKWNLSFTLQNPKFDEVFLRLTDDVHARSAAASSEQAALDTVGVVFDEWKRLLKPRASGLLSMEELRGLVGELWLILNEFSTTRSIEAAIEGWLGPMGLPQDFWYGGDGFREAKAIGPSMTGVRISSEHQLDAEDLELILLQIANTDEQTIGAINLPTMVGRALTALSDIGASADAFQERLARLGVDVTEVFYQDTWFVVARMANYGVDDGFPRIMASGLPAGVTRVTYQIELVAIEEFKRSETEVS
jgi:Putative  PD-(D/E)XK family member, (DUF4420)